MSRRETYPWALLTKVGDYFMVPTSVQTFAYMKKYVQIRNSTRKGLEKHVVADINGEYTIVILYQILDEIPPYEVGDESGILCVTSRKAMYSAIEDRMSDLGVKPVSKRSQASIVSTMSPEVREANLPWWYDPRTGKLVVNPKIVDEEDMETWVRGQFNPGVETPYPEKYHLDEHLLRKTRDQIMEELEEEDEWAGTPVTYEGDGE